MIYLLSIFFFFKYYMLFLLLFLLSIDNLKKYNYDIHLWNNFFSSINNFQNILVISNNDDKKINKFKDKL